MAGARATPEGDAETRGGFDPRRFTQIAGSIGHTGALGLAYRAHGADWAELALHWAEPLVGDPSSGVLASGPVVSLMDNACSIAVWLKLGRFRWQATLDLRVDYLRPATPGATLIGRGECYALKRRVAFVRGVAYHRDPGEPVASVAGSFIFTGD